MEQENRYTLTDVKQKFANARRLCPGMPEEMYALTDYIASVTNDTVTPEGLNLCLIIVSDDIQKERSGFGGEFPDYLKKHKIEVTDQIANFPQVVDALGNEEFAQEYRKVFKSLFNFEPPKKVMASSPRTTPTYGQVCVEDLMVIPFDTIRDTLPKYVQVAVDWWLNAVRTAKYDNISDMDPSALMNIMERKKPLTMEDVRAFEHNLAYAIEEQINEYGRCTLTVDYNPCPILAEAGGLIGLNSMLDYPRKTTMIVSKKEVIVSSGYTCKFTTLWSKEQELDVTPEDGTVKR